MVLHKIANILEKHRIPPGFSFAAVGTIIFLLIYFYSNMAFAHYYGSSAACTNSSVLGIMATAPINYCENFGSAQTFRQGLIGNMVIPAVIIFLAILYSWSFEREFKRYLSFREAIIVSVLATYGLSVFGLLVQGKVGGGTSILAFDVLLFMVLGLLADYTVLRAKRVEKTEQFKKSWAIEFIIALNARVGQRITKEDAAERLYRIAAWIYPVLILTGVLFLSTYIIPNPSAPYHMAGGFLLLLYLIVANRKKMFH